MSKQGRLYNFNALDVYKNLTKCIEYLGLPHSIHAHVEGYEQEQGMKNLYEILEEIKSLGLESPNNRIQLFHLAHASSYNVNGENGRLIDFFNGNMDFDLDLGFLGFNDINPLITSDRRLINSIANPEDPEKLIRSAIEFEGDSFSTNRNFNKKNEADCIIWANAIDLALNIKNKYQMQSSINYPNYANITDMPNIAAWLMSSESRSAFIKGMNSNFQNKTILKDNENTLTFNEFIIITRASPAKSLGLSKIKGNLGLGADGDVNILNINLTEMDVNKEYAELIKTLSNLEFVIKAGDVVKKNNNVILNNQGKIFWSNGKLEKEDVSMIMSKKKDFYQKYGSIFYDSFKNTIDSKFLRKI